MATSNNVHLQTALNLAKRIKLSFTNGNAITSNLNADLDTVIQSHLPLVRPSDVKSSAEQLEELGCALWNSAITVLRETENDRANSDNKGSKFVALLRSFAFFLLDLTSAARDADDQAQGLRARNLKIGLKAAQFALGVQQCELALTVLEKCSNYVESQLEETASVLFVVGNNDESDNLQVQHGRLMRALYLLLRIHHAKNIDHWDMAEHFYSKFNLDHLSSSNALTEQAVQLFHSCGSSLTDAGRHTTSIQWFQRALDVLNTCQEMPASPQTQELRLSTTARLVSVLLHSGSSDALEQASKLAIELDTLHGLGEHLTTAIVHTDIQLASKPLRKDLLKRTMTALIRCSLSELTFKLMMRAVQKVKAHDLECAEYTLHSLIVNRILSNNDAMQPEQHYEEWLENSLVNYVFLLPTEDDPAAAKVASSKLACLFNTVSDRTTRSLSLNAVHAIQTLLWKTINSLQSSAAAPWLVPLQHKLLASSGDSNRACIGRKAMQILISNSRYSDARAAFFRLPEAAQHEPSSRYLAFKIALHQSDHAWAVECLQVVARSDATATNLLYACALEAQGSANRALAALSLQAIADKASDTGVTPSLLRCLAYLQMNEIGNNNATSAQSLEAMVVTFERCMDSIKSRVWSDEDVSVETPWWSRAAYNLALKLSDTGDAETVIRLLKVCASLSSVPANDEQAAARIERKEKFLVANFLIATTYIVDGRSHSDQTESSLQSYLNARHYIRTYLDHWQPDANTQLNYDRAFELLRFDLEAICRLRQWDELDQSLDRSLAFPNTRHWQRLAEIVLVIHKELSKISFEEQSKHTPKILDILQRIVNDTWRRDKDVTQAARWVRVTFSIDTAAMDRHQSDGQVAFKLLGQAATIAKHGANGGNARYPADELQWLASVSFNRGIDCCMAMRREMAWKWFDAALELARHVHDNGMLLAAFTAGQAEAERRLNEISL